MCDKSKRATGVATRALDSFDGISFRPLLGLSEESVSGDHEAAAASASVEKRGVAIAQRVIR